MKFLETLKKYQQQFLLVLFFLLLLKSCGTNSEVSKLRKEISQLDANLRKEIKLEGLKSEKRMIQSTDRKMFDYQRQSAIDREIEKLNGK